MKKKSSSSAPTISLEELLSKAFDAYQREAEQGTTTSALATAAQLEKQLTLYKLNALNLDNNNNNDDEVDPVTSLLLQYMDAAIALEWNANSQDSIERVLELASALAVLRGEASATEVLHRALEFSNVSLDRCRSHACRVMGNLALFIQQEQERSKSGASPSSWGSTVLGDIRPALEARLTDKSQAVRQAAIKASTACFEDLDESEALLESLLWNLWHDPSVANRVEALQAVPVNNETADHIIARIRDVKEKVRLQALQVLKTKVDPVKILSPEQFADVIQSGLSVR
jgi:hypothetical protein